LYVDQLIGDAQTLDEALLVRCRWLSEDARLIAERLESDPASAIDLVATLSRAMQEIDHAAGASAHAHETVRYARRWALLLPSSAIHEDAEDEPA
jgi:hypothetical protein